MASEERKQPEAGNVYRSIVTANLKRFDPHKGFGFVTTERGGRAN